jgi:phosphatidylinositol glycan class W
VTEYGVHWNFYFTLGGVYLAYSLLHAFGKWATNPAVALLILIGTSLRPINCSFPTQQEAHVVYVGYQLYLTHDGGEDFILYAPRDTLFEQNREGILSLAGYTSLYMLAVFTGQVTFGYMESNGAKAIRNMRWLALSFTVLTIVLVVATFVAVRLVARPSRRMVRSTHLSSCYVWVCVDLETGHVCGYCRSTSRTCCGSWPRPSSSLGCTQSSKLYGASALCLSYRALSIDRA